MTEELEQLLKNRVLSVRLRNANRTGSGSTENVIRGSGQPVSL
jgi:hypothetical protein